jgi:hypothetical protein
VTKEREISRATEPTTIFAGAAMAAEIDGFLVASGEVCRTHQVAVCLLRGPDVEPSEDALLCAVDSMLNVVETITDEATMVHLFMQVVLQRIVDKEKHQRDAQKRARHN